MKNLFKIMSLCLILQVLLSACSKSSEVWVYTSLAPDAQKQLETKLQTQFKNYKIHWVQNGSEDIVKKMDLESKTPNAKADIVMAMDPFWFRQKASEGFFEAYQSPADALVPATFKGQASEFSSVYFSAYVMGYNNKKTNASAVPPSYLSLNNPEFYAKVAAPSPLESVSSLVLMQSLASHFDYNYLSRLKQNGLKIAGNPSSIIRELVLGERAVALVPLDQLLLYQKQYPELQYTLPSEGVVLLPTHMALVKKEKEASKAVKEVYNYLMSDEAQKTYILAHQQVYGPAQESQSGVLAQSLIQNSLDAGEKFWSFAKAESANFKKKFTDLVLR